MNLAFKNPDETHWVTQKQSSKVGGGLVKKQKIINGSKKRKEKAEYD